MRTTFAVVVCLVHMTVQGQILTDLTVEETKRVFSGLGPAVHILGQRYQPDSLARRMDHYDVPGLGIVLIENNTIRWARYFGVREKGSPAPIDSNTRFMVKSLSKPVAAFAALMLTAQGMLDLDTPLDTYLTGWNIPDNEFTADERPTLRHLLSHSAGFTLHGVPSYKETESLPTLIQALNGEPPAKPDRVTIDYVPGRQTRYSGGGYSVLQLLLEEMAGKGFPQLMQSLILDTLGMTRSIYASRMPPAFKSSAAVGHDRNGNPIDGKWEGLVQMAAGGLISTPVDMARFVIEVNLAWKGESLLLPDTLAHLMVTPNEAGWGLGLEILDKGSQMRFSHTGSGDGFRAILIGFPALRKGAVILANGVGGSELRYEILRSLANEYAWPSPRVIQRPSILLPADQMRSYVGRYVYADGSATIVTYSEGQLFTEWRGMPPTAIYPQNRSLFFSVSNEEYIFTFAEDGAPSALTWKGSFGEFHADRSD
jgi:CubicO group peptidase (beta-lactamase class C family)